MSEAKNKGRGKGKKGVYGVEEEYRDVSLDGIALEFGDHELYLVKEEQMDKDIIGYSRDACSPPPDSLWPHRKRYFRYFTDMPARLLHPIRLARSGPPHLLRAVEQLLGPLGAALARCHGELFFPPSPRPSSHAAAAAVSGRFLCRRLRYSRAPGLSADTPLARRGARSPPGHRPSCFN